MLEQLFNHLFKNLKLDKSKVGEIVVGNVIQPGSGIYQARLGQTYAGIPYTVPLSCVNRFCGSGLEACGIVAAKIKAGFINCGIGAGVESMSIYEMTSLVDPNKLNEKCFDTQKTRDVLTTMGRTSEVRYLNIFTLI